MCSVIEVLKKVIHFFSEHQPLHTSPRFTEDQSDNGCYATDQELRDLLDFLNRNSILDGQWPSDEKPWDSWDSWDSGTEREKGHLSHLPQESRLPNPFFSGHIVDIQIVIHGRPLCPQK